MGLKVTIFKKSSEMTNENIQQKIDQRVLSRHDVSKEEVLKRLPPQVRAILELYSFWLSFPSTPEDLGYKSALSTRKFNLDRLSTLLESTRAEDVYQNTLDEIPVDYDKIRQYIMTYEQMTDDSGEVVGLGFYSI